VHIFFLKKKEKEKEGVCSLNLAGVAANLYLESCIISGIRRMYLDPWTEKNNIRIEFDCHFDFCKIKLDNC
jgi:hypothetical protein